MTGFDSGLTGFWANIQNLVVLTSESIIWVNVVLQKRDHFLSLRQVAHLMYALHDLVADYCYLEPRSGSTTEPSQLQVVDLCS